MPNPLVSCLCITQPGRESLLEQAIACFGAQTYPNTELVIVTDGDRAHYDKVVAASARELGGIRMIRIVPVASIVALSLGALRNIAVDRADGEILIQWDDDDLYHPERIAIQAEPVLAGAKASFLTDQLYQFTDTGEFAWVDWNRRKGIPPMIPGTIAIRADEARKIRYPEDGAVAARGEDDRYKKDLLALPGGNVALLDDKGWCYVRRHHGSNTWNRAHFEMNARMSRPAIDVLKAASVLGRELRRYEHLAAPFRFKWPGDVRVDIIDSLSWLSRPAGES